MQYVNSVVETLLAAEAHKATKYISEKEVVRATRRMFRDRFMRGNLDIVLTIGRPNYAERKFIAGCRAAGQKFPVQKIQLKYPAKRKR